MLTQALSPCKVAEAPKTYRERMKWVFLSLFCLSQLGVMYNLTPINTLQKAFELEMKINNKEYSNVIIAEGAAGILFPIIAGLLIDSYGGSFGFTTGVVLGFIGQALSTFATYNLQYSLFVISRVLVTLGYGAMLLSRTQLLGNWYDKHELGKVTSITVVTQLMMSVLCSIVYPSVYEAFNLLWPSFLIGAAICAASLLIVVAQVSIHNKMLKEEEDNQSKSKQASKVSLMVVKEFPLSYWLVCIASIFSIVSCMGAKSFISKHLQNEFGFEGSEGGYFLAFGVAVSGVGAPFAGFLISRYGRIPLVLIGSSATILVGLFGFIYTPHSNRSLLPAIPLSLLSFGSGAIQVIILNSLMLLITESKLGMGWAFYTIILGTTISVFIGGLGAVAHSTAESHGYFWVFMLCCGLVGLAVLFGLFLQVVDKKSGQRLQEPGHSHLKRLMMAKSMAKEDTDAETTANSDF